MSVVYRLEQSATEQLVDWFRDDYGLQYVFGFIIRGDRLMVSYYKTNAEGRRYLVCDRCGKPKKEDDCCDSKMIAAAETADLPLTSRPPFPVVAGKVG